MIDFAKARRMMVDGQVRANDVTDARVIAAFLDTPRESFLPADKKDIAYLDMDVPVGEAQARRFVIEPMVLAKLIQAAGIGESDRVLDVGSATGYSAAVLGRVAREVVALESEAGLAGEAGRALGDLANVTTVTGPLAAGHAAGGPYDAIVLEGAVGDVPSALFAQLKDGGRLAAVIGTGRSARATVFVRSGKEVSGREVFDAALPALAGFETPEVFAF